MTTLPDDPDPNNLPTAESATSAPASELAPAPTTPLTAASPAQTIEPARDPAEQLGAAIATVALGAQLLAREVEPYARAYTGFLERVQRGADRITGTPRARQIMEAIEAQNAMRELAMIGGPRGLRDLQRTREALEHAGLVRREPLARSARLSLDAPSRPPPPPAPPSPSPEELKREAAKQRREAAKQRRHEELCALAPRAQLACLRPLLRRRPHAKVAGDYGMTAGELRDLIERARSAIAPPRRHRKRG